MRRTRKGIQAASENGRRRALISNQVQADGRLARALDFCAPKDELVFEIETRNPRTGICHRLEILHEAYGGADRFAVVVDGERWRNGWSRTRFVNWIFKQIDSVRRDWD